MVRGRTIAAQVQTTRRGRRLYGDWLDPNSLCFDVGANVGNRTRILLSLGCRVVAIEPQPQCIEALRRIRNRRLIVEPVALGAGEGMAELHLSTASTISSMSDGWIARVRASGRFSAHDWPTTMTVPVTSLDALIARYGRPDFCKIDVEGYEAEVVEGLSQPLPMLSFEFTPEWHQAAYRVVQRLADLGFDAFNVSFGESLALHWSEWRDTTALLTFLAALPHDGLLFGDVYARTHSHLTAPKRSGVSGSRGTT